MKRSQSNRRGNPLFAVSACLLLLLPVAACRTYGNQRTESLPPAHLSSVPLSYADIVQQVSPAVVTVRSSRRVAAPTQYPFTGSNFFQQLFGGGMASPRPQVERALGSGVVVRSDGHILTNHHVINGAQEIKVDLTNGRTYTARLVGADPPSDLAVLKIDASNLAVLSLGDSDKVRVGDVCLAVGNPLGVGETVTSGIISAKGRRTGLSNGAFEDFLQTDAPINQGNSGGALVNTTGALIGINSQIISTTGGNIGLGFAIPSNMAKTVMDQLIGKGKVVRGHIGITVQPITSGLAESFGLQNVQGVLVNGVEPGGPADRSGIKPGDIITQLNGKKVEDPNQFRNQVAAEAPGTSIALTVVREGKQMQMQTTLSDASANAPASQSGGQGGQPSSSGKLGVTVQPMTPEIASQIGVPPDTSGLVISSVNPTGAAADAGLQAGDVIVSINRQPIRSQSDVAGALAKSSGHPALLLVNRGGQTFFVSVNAG